MQICATSDLHGNLPEIEPCDLLIIAGDIAPDFTSPSLGHIAPQRKWMRTEFVEWLKGVPADEIVYIAGNHDYHMEDPSFAYVSREILRETGAAYLRDTDITVNGTKIFGMPWVPNLEGWAFYLPDAELQEKAAQIPEDADIVVLHGPPAGVLDQSFWGASHLGSSAVASRLQQVLPKLCIFGHVHEHYGSREIGETTFANVSLCDLDYKPVQPPQYFDLD